MAERGNSLIYLPMHSDCFFFLILDIDECAPNVGLGPCEMLCNNLNGSYACACDEGYALRGDMVSCESKRLISSRLCLRLSLFFQEQLIC